MVNLLTYNKLLRFLASFFSSNKINNLKIKKIVIHRIGSIGDSIVALPAIYNIRKNFPKSEIFILNSSDDISFREFKNLIKHYNVNYYSYSLKNLNFFNALKLIFFLRKQDIDLWISLPQDLTNLRTELRNLLFSKLCKSKIIYGFEISVDRKVIQLQKNSLMKNEKVRLLNITEKYFKKKLSKIIPDMDYLKASHNSMNQKFDELVNRIQNKNSLCICLGSKKESNKWKYENYLYIAEKWIKRNGIVLLLGGKSEKIYAQKIVNSISNSNVINLTGNTSIEESANLIFLSKIILGNDTGLIHFADLFNKTLFSIFSCRDFKGKWFPTNKNSFVFRPNFDCNCFLKDLCQKKCIDLNNKSDVWKDLEMFI